MRRGAFGQRNRKNSAPWKLRQLWVISGRGKMWSVPARRWKKIRHVGKASASLASHNHLATHNQHTQEDTVPTTSRHRPVRVPKTFPLLSLLHMIQEGIDYRSKMHFYDCGDLVDSSASSSDELEPVNCSLTTILEEPDVFNWPHDRYISRCIINRFSTYYDTKLARFSSLELRRVH